jgi:hypothetical protein
VDDAAVRRPERLGIYIKVLPLAVSAPVITDAPATIVRPAPAGAVVFSRYDPASRRYRLARRTAAGTVQTFAVPSRPVAYDVDVGPDPDGREVAVYSRCRHEPAFVSPGGGLSYYRSGEGCRLYSLSLKTGRERRLHTSTERSGSDFLPTIWRTRLAWAHVAKGKLSLMVRDGGRTRRLRAGTTSVDRLGQGVRAPGVRGLDLRGDRLALVWSYYDDRDHCGSNPPSLRIPVDEVWSYRLGASRRRVARAGCSGDAALRIGWAQLTPSGLSYSATIGGAETVVGPDGRRTFTLPDGASDFIQTFARLDDGRLVVAYDGLGSGLAIG